jgi:magnesium chelatase family protein
LVKEPEVYPATSLLQICAHLAGRELLQLYSARPETDAVIAAADYPGLEEVKGQAHAKRALEIAAACGHSVLMLGPPGTGKSMLAAHFPGILPSMTEKEALESTTMQSLSSSVQYCQLEIPPLCAPT